jgi:outer membrane protein
MPRILPALSLGLCLVAPLAAQSPEDWTLAGAIAQARHAHPDALLALAQVELATASLEEAGAMRWPRVHLAGRYFQTTHPMQGFGAILSQGTFDETIDFNAPGQLDGLSVGLEVAYPLYTGGRREALLGAARKRLEARQFDRATAEARLADAVVAGYFTIRQADALMDSIGSGIAVLEETLRVSRAREASGDLIRTERLNLEVELARLERERLAAAHRQRLARSRFAFLLGSPPGTVVRLAGNDPAVAAMSAPDLLTTARRSELEAARAEVAAAREHLSAARAGQRPSLNAFARGDLDKGFRREGDGTSWTAGVAVEMPLFDGFATRSRMRQAQARQRLAEEQLRRLELSLALELEQARLDHELALAQLRVTRQQVAQATEAAELSRERFAAGSLLSTELIGVESRLVDARVQEALATHAERASLAHLRRAAGLPILP